MTIKELKDILDEYPDNADVIIGVTKIGKYYNSVDVANMNTEDPQTGESIKTPVLIV